MGLDRHHLVAFVAAVARHVVFVVAGLFWAVDDAVPAYTGAIARAGHSAGRAGAGTARAAAAAASAGNGAARSAGCAAARGLDFAARVSAASIQSPSPV